MWDWRLENVAIFDRNIDKHASSCLLATIFKSRIYFFEISMANSNEFSRPIGRDIWNVLSLFIPRGDRFISVSNHPSSWGLPCIPDNDCNNASFPRFLNDIVNLDALEVEIRADLSLANATCFVDSPVGNSSRAFRLVEGFPSGGESSVKQVNTDTGKYGGTEEQGSGPVGHILLSLQILIGSLIAIVGFNVFGYAGSESVAGSILTGFGYFMAGCTAVTFGVALILGAGVVPLNVLF